MTCALGTTADEGGAKAAVVDALDTADIPLCSVCKAPVIKLCQPAWGRACRPQAGTIAGPTNPRCRRRLQNEPHDTRNCTNLVMPITASQRRCHQLSSIAGSDLGTAHAPPLALAGFEGRRKPRVEMRQQDSCTVLDAYQQGGQWKSTNGGA